MECRVLRLSALPRALVNHDTRGFGLFAVDFVLVRTRSDAQLRAEVLALRHQPPAKWRRDKCPLRVCIPDTTLDASGRGDSRFKSWSSADSFV